MARGELVQRCPVLAIVFATTEPTRGGWPAGWLPPQRRPGEALTLLLEETLSNRSRSVLLSRSSMMKRLIKRCSTAPRRDDNEAVESAIAPRCLTQEQNGAPDAYYRSRNLLVRFDATVRSTPIAQPGGCLFVRKPCDSLAV